MKRLGIHSDMDGDRLSRSLALARTWYLMMGGAALLLTAGHAYGAVAAASRFDAPLVIAGMVIGTLSLAAAAWVVSAGAWRAALASSGIVAGFVPLAVASWIALTTASLDAQALIGVPAMIGLVAGLRMAVARSRSRVSSLG